MVSGDNLQTAQTVAIRAGILTEEEANQKYAVMSADEFRRLVGGIRKEMDGR